MKEAEIELNLQNIIDAAVSRQAASSSAGEPEEEFDEVFSIPSSEELNFREMEKYDDASVANLFVAANDDSSYDSAAADIIHTAETVDMADDSYSPGTVDIADITNVAYAAETVNDEDITNVAYAAETVNYENITDVAYAPEPENVGIFSYAAQTSNSEGKLIFLSRTLSGLVDLLLIVLFSGAFLCAADWVTNAPMLHSINVASFASLFLMIFFLYSIFLLGTNGQTIGMMATDLRVVGIHGNRPKIKQVAGRSIVFLVSLFGLGIGLLVGVFSRKCLCLHDRLSQTHVVRISGNAD